MPATYPLTPPSTPGPATARILARSTVAVSESPFTLQQQTQEFAGQRWELDLAFPPMERGPAEAWIAFQLLLRGRRGTFLYPPPGGKSPRGIATGTPLVNGGGQTGDQLVTDGWTPSQTGILLAGDFLQLGSGSTARLYKVIEDASSDGGGNATLRLWPDLRSPAVANDSPIVVQTPKGLWRLASNEAPWDLSVAMHYGIAFGAQEAL